MKTNVVNSPSHGEHSDHPFDQESPGTTLAPPVFQLQASGPPPDGNDDSNAGNPAAIGSGGVVQRQGPNLCQDEPACVDNTDPWEHFASEFNENFANVLHTFETESGNPGAAEREAGAAVARGHDPGDRSGDVMSAEQLRSHFTESQRVALMGYMASNVIPDRLFNGDDQGNTTAQQRLLISAQILANGVYSPGSFTQGVHARMCYHWVRITHHYAGVTTETLMNEGVMGNFDHEGNVVLGAGRAITVQHDDRHSIDSLPDTETGGLGPIHEGTGHADRVASGQRAHRSQAFPFDRFDELNPGDWLYYYNGNASGGGSHSVIFSRWSGQTGETDGIAWREAICFSQGSPSAGGREHTTRLGGQFVPAIRRVPAQAATDTEPARPAIPGRAGVYPITSISRMSTDARPASTVEGLLPTRSARRETALIGANAAFVSRAARRYGRPVDEALLFQTLRTENQGHIETIRERLSPGQLRLLTEANRTDNLERMIRLSQRLRALANNSQLLEANTEAAYGGTPAVEATRGRRARRARTGLNERHAEAQGAFEEVQRSTAADIAAIDEELNPLLAQIADLESSRESLANPASLIQDARARARQLRRQLDRMGRPRRDSEDRAEYDAMRAERLAVIDSIANLRVDQRDYNRQRTELRNQIRAIERLARPLRNRRARFERRREQAQGDLPYGLVHTGRLGSQQSGRMTGSLEDLYSLREMRQFITPEQAEGGAAEGGATE